MSKTIITYADLCTDNILGIILQDFNTVSIAIVVTGSSSAQLQWLKTENSDLDLVLYINKMNLSQAIYDKYILGDYKYTTYIKNQKVQLAIVDILDQQQITFNRLPISTQITCNSGFITRSFITVDDILWVADSYKTIFIKLITHKDFNDCSRLYGIYLLNESFHKNNFYILDYLQTTDNLKLLYSYCKLEHIPLKRLYTLILGITYLQQSEITANIKYNIKLLKNNISNKNSLWTNKQWVIEQLLWWLKNSNANNIQTIKQQLLTYTTEIIRNAKK